MKKRVKNRVLHLLEVHLVQHLHEAFVKVVALIALLMGAAHTAFVQIADIECPLAALDERRVGAVDVRLFCREIGVLSHFWGL